MIRMTEKGKDTHRVTLALEKDTGTASILARYMRFGNEMGISFHQLLDSIFDYIA